MLSSNATERKNIPIVTGVLDYFPLALAEIARVSQVGNEQHNPGQPLHWDKSKSTDHADSLVRHLMERGTADTDGMRHTAKVAWRALALLQTELENEEKIEEVPPEDRDVPDLQEMINNYAEARQREVENALAQNIMEKSNDLDGQITENVRGMIQDYAVSRKEAREAANRQYRAFLQNMATYSNWQMLA